PLRSQTVINLRPARVVSERAFRITGCHLLAERGLSVWHMRILNFVFGPSGRALPVLAVASLTGCQTAGYYAQAIRGHCQVMAQQQPILELLRQPQTPEPLKGKLQLVLALREFAD